MALHLPTGPLKTRYRDANPVPSSPLADDLATAPSGPVTPVLMFHVMYRSLTGVECVTRQVYDGV